MKAKERTLRAGDWPVQRWQEHFGGIYGEKNRRFSESYIWLRMLEEVTELIKPVQRTKLKEIEWQIPDVFAWICAFCSKRGIPSLDDLLWDIYKNGCRSCRNFTCQCKRQPETDSKPNVREKKKGRNQEPIPFERPTSLIGWQIFFNKMYGETNEQFDAKDTVTNLAIDIGKVSRHLRLKEDENILPGVASIMAWLLALCNQFSSNISEGEFRLADLLSEKYGSGCPACKKSICECIGPISTFFVSFPGELQKDAEFVKAELETREYSVHLFPFPEQGPHFNEGRMQAAFEQIEGSDGAFVLFKSQLRPAVYAEFQMIWYSLPKERIFVLVNEERGSDRDESLKDLIDEIKVLHTVSSYESQVELRETLKNSLTIIG